MEDLSEDQDITTTGATEVDVIGNGSARDK